MFEALSAICKRPALCRLAGATALALAAALAGGVNRSEAEEAKYEYFLRSPVRDPDHIFQKRVWSWTDLKRRNVVMQQRDFSCGAAALATLMRYYWDDNVTEDYFLNQLDKMLTHAEAVDRLKNGLTLTDLKRVSSHSGYDATIGTLTFPKLTESKVPLIIGLSADGYDHFVVYRGAFGEYVYLADPIRGNVRLPAWEFVRQWKGNAVLVVAQPGKEPKKYSALTVTQSEHELGRLNDLVVRKHLSRP